MKVIPKIAKDIILPEETSKCISVRDPRLLDCLESTRLALACACSGKPLRQMNACFTQWNATFSMVLQCLDDWPPHIFQQHSAVKYAWDACWFGFCHFKSLNLDILSDDLKFEGGD